MFKGYWKKSLTIVIAFQIVASFLFVAFRTMDADEGFYLAAAQRVADGMTPYVDFFFPQMPLLPLTFFGLSGWGISSLVVLRSIAALAGLLLTIVVYRFVYQRTTDSRIATTTSFLVAFSGLSLTWHSTFKPYAFVDLFLFISFALLISLRGTQSGLLRKIFLTMLALGLAINFRSVFAVALPLYLYVILKESGAVGTSKVKVWATAFAGLIVPSLPALYLFFREPGDFLFNNLGFHLQREPITPLSALLLHKISIIGEFLALPQTILILGAIIASYVLVRLKQIDSSWIYRPAAIMAGLIFLVYLIPTPVHLQYFQQLIPYLIICCLPAIAFVLKYDKLKVITRSAGVLYIVGVLPFIYLFILYPRARDQRFAWEHLNSVVTHIQDNSSSEDTLLSEWAGYAALSKRRQLPSTEHVGFYFPLKIEPSQYHDHHLLTNNDIVQALDERRPELVVVDYQVYPEWEQALNANYHLVNTDDKTFIYKKNHEPL